MNITRLMQIECRKMRLERFYKQVLIANIAIVILVLITKFTFSLSNDTEIPALSTVSIIDTLVKAVFVVWQSVMIAYIIVEEFRSKTALLLFSYPIKRGNIIASKLALIIIMTFSAMLITQVFVNGIVFVLNAVFPFIDYQISITDVLQLFITSVAAICMGMAPLYIGMLNKSTVTTVVSSIAIVSLTVGSGVGDGARMINILPVSLVLASVGIGLAYISIKKISIEDTVL
ncbi:ABC transporter permease [Desulfitobacterium sp. Sab5]|uniref:ABC transporter permease n=1 Tax=Desulfitobacterium nosdiversum TaxID=3375356 RepID=UPI003CF4A6E0